MSKVAFQIGRTKNRKRTQGIEAWVNDLKVDWSDGSGTFLTSFKDGKLRNTIWYLYVLEMSPGDILRIEVKTFLPGVGKDLELTFESIYTFDEEVDVDEVFISNVGMKNYPLIKGRVIEVAMVTEDEKRKQGIEDVLSEGF